MCVVREGFISGEEDMLHDLEEMDRRDAGILTRVKRHTVIHNAGILGYSVDNEEGVASIAEMYALSVDDVKRALTEPFPALS